MQIDMHFYGTYALARAAGLPPEVARTVATAAQFVDDADTRETIRLSTGEQFRTVVSSHGMLSPENLNEGDQWRVWMPYHFLPGGVGQNNEEKLICRPGVPGNSAADAAIALALEHKSKPYGPHLLGIVSHVIEDTFSHYGFSGVTSDYNTADQDSFDFQLDDQSIETHVRRKIELQRQKILGTGGELAKMGHGAVGELPDRPYLAWSFNYERPLNECPRIEQGQASQRDNVATYYAAAERLHDLYRRFADNNPFVPEPLRFRPLSGIAEKVRGILRFEGTKDDRGEQWKRAALDGWLFDPKRVEQDGFIDYDKDAFWHGELAGMDSPQTSDAYLFHQASRLYRDFVLGPLVVTRLGLDQI